ncbi:MAG: hypothetical protein OMM_09656 [Candidatus Magnetoglobus multicellularis str. Araruama]|uniref:YgiT-type zinc finger domain-containing protein n=1 Tax=Candidatus Magnetoglobus multicellularis str. Araruama TaxID=890399 RepID=A0A1V1P3I8_9BACT|nr:MAG: hypothetical protein OMM_09656 [Candidatus Magnetoglobus multicellularis str. Araruama]
MNIVKNKICKACRSGELINNEVTQSFEREGLNVKIDGIPALVCRKCGQIYFKPGLADKINLAANHLFMLSEAKHAGEYKAAA